MIQDTSIHKQDWERFNAIMDDSSFVFLSWDISTLWHLNYVSKTISQYGYKQEEFLSDHKKYLQIIYFKDRKHIISEIKTNIYDGNHDCFNQTYRIVNVDGGIHWIDAYIVVERDKQNHPIKCFCIIKESQQKNIQKQMVDNLSSYSIQELKSMNVLIQAVKQTNDMVRITDPNGVILFANDAFVEHTGYSLEETVGDTPKLINSGEHDKDFYKKLWNTIQDAKVYNAVFKNRKKDGTLYYEAETISPILDEETNIQYYVATGKDISERIELENHLHQQATTDLLTGIYNRQKFIEELELEIDRVKHYNSTFALIMIDLDHFKEFNDNFGHDVGDTILKEVSNVISKQIRRTDIFARWGGEEFMIIAPEFQKKKAAVELAEKIRMSIESHHFKHVGTVTISLGVTLSKTADTVDDIFKRTDDALYYAKRHGRNQTHFI
jgi:diguanylate cyclase (GGDEF)-like protein/PAS domain S-box-containing protein